VAGHAENEGRNFHVSKVERLQVEGISIHGFTIQSVLYAVPPDQLQDGVPIATARRLPLLIHLMRRNKRGEGNPFQLHLLHYRQVASNIQQATVLQNMEVQALAGRPLR